MSKVKIKDHDALVRDEKTQAVLNVDGDSLKSYKANRDRQRQVSESLAGVSALRSEVARLNSDISEIKNMLSALLGGDKK